MQANLERLEWNSWNGHLVRTDADGKSKSELIDLNKLAQPGSADLGPLIQFTQ